MLEKISKRFDRNPSLYDLILDIRRIWPESRMMNALPDTIDEVHFVLSEGKDISHLYQPNATRSIEWLQKNGKCVDNILPRPSTIPGIGEGAFAKRRLPKGSIITGSPVMVIPKDQFMNMYTFHLDDNNHDDRTDEVWLQGDQFSKQIIYNYCFGHPESTVLLFPVRIDHRIHPSRPRHYINNVRLITAANVLH